MPSDNADQGPSHTQVSVRWGLQQIQLVVDGSQTWSQKAPRHRGHRAKGPQSHTLFVGGLPDSSYSSKLPVRTILVLAWVSTLSSPSLTPAICSYRCL